MTLLISKELSIEWLILNMPNHQSFHQGIAMLTDRLEACPHVAFARIVCRICWDISNIFARKLNSTDAALKF